MTHTVAILCICGYLLATIFLMLQLWRPSRGGRTAVVAKWCTILGFTLHTLTMFLVFSDMRWLALENGADHFLWVSWVLALVCLIAQRWFSAPLLAVFAIPAIVLCMTSSSILLHQGSPSHISGESEVIRQGVAVSLLHAVPALVSVVSMILALIVSSVFLITEGRLKRRSALALVADGPSLQVLDTWNRHLVQIGFVALSLVIVSGGLWAILERKKIFTADTSVVSGIIVWGLLALILHARIILKWSPKRISRLTVLVMASFFAVVFLAATLAGRITHARLLWWG
jgi:ABC-type transport system involved in cytochrome c biogenesis permease subunit